MRIAKLENVGRTFEDGARRREVLHGIELEVDAGELVALVGPSGCGKTTLLTILGALDGGYSGKVELLGSALDRLSEDQRTALRNERIGFVFQAFHLLDHLTVAQNVEVPIWLLPQRPSRNAERARAKEVLALVGLADRLDDPVPSMSGGERQRVAIARAVVNRPKLLLADEPTGNLDRETGALILEIFERVRREEQCAVVVATHDPDLAARAGRTVRLNGGRLS
jgi:putative ABC transport system ATP-binding protein